MPFSFNFGGFNPGDFSGFGGFQDEGAAPPPKKPRKPRKADIFDKIKQIHAGRI